MNEKRTPTNSSQRLLQQPQVIPPSKEGPLLNYTLSTVCPACTNPTIRRACKVRCERCGFMWDCSEL